MKNFIITLLLSSFTLGCYAGEGMWLPLLLKSLNEAEMQGMGMKMSAEDIYSVNQGSLKDAIVHFGGFCTSEIISDQGLLLTNHHCGYGQIRSHSSVEANYLKEGFWAKAHSEELPNPGLTATLIQRMEDVTDAVLEGVTDEMTEDERSAAIDANIKKVQGMIKKESYEDVFVRAFYYGNAYYAFVTITYKDIRLVGAPPESVGKFGADTDNWVWPRHTGDFALFRIYAGPDNLPADYSGDNVPYKPKHFLPISLDGVEAGDFTMVFGFPGRTQEYLPGVAVKQVIEDINPAKISIRDAALKIMDKYMRTDAKTKIQYASKFARIANGWKKWIGESQGLVSTGALDKKQKLEKQFTKAVKNSPSAPQEYLDLLPQFDKLYGGIRDYNVMREYYNEVFFRNTEIFARANRILALKRTLDNDGKEAWAKALAQSKEGLLGAFKDYRADIDQEVATELMMLFLENVSQDYLPPTLANGMVDREAMATWVEVLFDDSHLSSESKLRALLEADAEAFAKMVKSDDIMNLTAEVRNTYNQRISPEQRELSNQITLLQRTYMKAQMEMFPDKRFYPDANSTLRITYGQVDGYEPKDAVAYTHQTYLDGVIEKYVPGDYEFDVDQKLLELYENKDYGQYADETGRVPVCFIGSNHTTGGNSGSPAIDAHGNLIGLNFDRTWEGTMSDLNYDPSICRNIMVDIRYVLFMVDKHAGAGHLVDEMKLVRPKSDMASSQKIMEEPVKLVPMTMKELKRQQKEARKELKEKLKKAA